MCYTLWKTDSWSCPKLFLWYKKGYYIRRKSSHILEPLDNTRNSDKLKEKCVILFFFVFLHAVTISVKRCFFRDKHLILRFLGISFLQHVLKSSRWLSKSVARYSLGQSNQSVTKGISCVGRRAVFLNRLLRRIRQRSELPVESDEKQMRSFDFAVKELLSVPDFMPKTKFRAKALKVAKSKIDIERDRGKRTKASVMAQAVLGVTFSTFIEQVRHYLKNVVKELLRHSSFKSDFAVD